MTHRIAELREKLKVFEAHGLKASADNARREIRELQGLPPAQKPKPRKRVAWSRPSKKLGHFFVRLTCGHRFEVQGVATRDGFKRAPHTAVCEECLAAKNKS